MISVTMMQHGPGGRMKRLLALISLVLLSAAMGTVSLGTAGAAATTSPYVALLQHVDGLPVDVTPGTTQVYVVHGLNLAGQAAQGDRGSAVTVCAGDTALIGDLQFGDVSGALPLASGLTMAIKVFVGAGVDCASTATPLIRQEVTVPAVEAAALVATSAPGAFAPELIPVVLNVTAPAGCAPAATPDGAVVSQVQPQFGRIQVAHVAAAPALFIDIAATTNGPLSYSESLDKEEPAGGYPVAAFLDPQTPVLESPALAQVTACGLAVVYIVGNQPLPEPPTTTVTTPPAPAAVAATASPSFTG